MTWMIAGGDGMLGQDVAARARAGGHEVITTDRSTLDITDLRAVRAGVSEAGVVINCAAFTGVDDAETHEGAAFLVNAVGPQYLATACREAGARLVQISTDYVFDGSGTSPYGEADPLRPLGAYGRTKAAGEWAVRAQGADALIVRTAWLYGAGGPCFPKTMARLLTTRDHVDVVGDQVGQPTWTRDLADLIIRLLEADAPAGTYHGTASGQCSWHEFTEEIARSIGVDRRSVRPTTSEAFARPAPRPGYSVLGHTALEEAGVTPIGPWEDRWRQAAASVLADSGIRVE